MKILALFISILTILSCTSSSNMSHVNEPKASTSVSDGDTTIVKVVKTEEEWKEQLTTEEFRVLREAGTQQAFTCDLWDNTEEGTYVCAGCEFPLFSSDSKFKSGTGWPSFYEPLNKSCIGEVADYSYGWNRVEVICNQCDGHQGHVFTDGPQPTGLRYCINGVSLNFIPK